MTYQIISEVHNMPAKTKAQEIKLGTNLYLQAELLKLGLRTFRLFGFFSSTCNALLLGNGHVTTIDQINTKMLDLYERLSVQANDIVVQMNECSERVSAILIEDQNLQSQDVDAVISECSDFKMHISDLLTETKRLAENLRLQNTVSLQIEIPLEILKRNDESISNILKAIDGEMSSIQTMMKTVSTFDDGPDHMQNYTEKFHLGGKLKLFWPTEATHRAA